MECIIEICTQKDVDREYIIQIEYDATETGGSY